MIFIDILYYTFLSALAVQLFFWLSFLRLLFKKSAKPADKPAPVSVIVCAWNENQNLRELVPLLLSQDHQNYEVIIVDDRSTDESYDYLIEQRDKNKNFKHVRVDTVPDHIDAKKYAVTLGVKAAQNDHLLFTDADCRPQSNQWVSQMVSEFQDETIFVLGYSPYTFSWSLLGLMIGFETLLTGIHYLTAALWGMPYMGVGRNLMYRKSYFLQHKGFIGFNNVTGGDDDLLVNKHGTSKNTRVCIDENAAVFSIPKTTFTSYFIQKKRHLSVGKHYQLKDKIRLGIHSISQILFWICLLSLAILEINPYVIGGGYLIRLIIQLVVMGFGARKLSDKFPVYLLPLMDFIYTLYIPLVGLPALLSKKVKWS
ncbi:MAG: glycosyltransferase [Cyclobacteriaceae bacterium]